MIERYSCFSRNRIAFLIGLTCIALQVTLGGAAFCMTLGGLDEELNAAIKIYNERKYKQAFSNFALLAQKRPGDPNVQYYLGLCYFQLGDKIRARRHLEWIFDSPAETSLKTQSATALNLIFGVKDTADDGSIVPRLGISRGVDRNGVNIGCDLGQCIPGQGKQMYTGYSVYIPTNYTGSEKLPWILALSPSGKSQDWMEMLPNACDKHHWGIAASQNSSDSIAWPKIEPVLKDTVDSAPSRFPFDSNNLCVIGFSGAAARTHQMAHFWPNVRKIIVCNGCIADEELNSKNYPKGKSVVFIAGSMDPIVSKMKRDQQFLMQQGWKTKWIEFHGGHQFPPPSAFADAIEWLSAIK
jgi:predicted esterase